MRKQLIEMEQELTQATHEKTRQQAEELRAARLVMQDMTRQEASVCLDLRRANSRLAEAQKVIDSKDEQIHRQEQALSERRASIPRDRLAASRYAGGVDPAVGHGRGAVGPLAL